MNEEKAKTKLCPMSMHPLVVDGVVRWEPSYCQGSACAAWRYLERYKQGGVRDYTAGECGMMVMQ